MADESLCFTRTVDAPAAAVFDVLADPSSHAGIDGTGWVRDPLDPETLTTTGQVFGMAMFHRNHPDGDYRMHNRVELLERPRTIAWQPGQYGPSGTLDLGGWTWRYDIASLGDDACEVTLTYDWSAVPAPVREAIGFPPVGEDHFTGSLERLAALAEGDGRR